MRRRIGDTHIIDELLPKLFGISFSSNNGGGLISIYYDLTRPDENLGCVIIDYLITKYGKENVRFDWSGYEDYVAQLGLSSSGKLNKYYVGNSRFCKINTKTWKQLSGYQIYKGANEAGTSVYKQNDYIWIITDVTKEWQDVINGVGPVSQDSMYFSGIIGQGLKEIRTKRQLEMYKNTLNNPNPEFYSDNDVHFGHEIGIWQCGGPLPNFEYDVEVKM